MAEEVLAGNVNLNFATQVSDETDCTIRVATPEFVQGGVLPPRTSVVIDVDVFTREPFKATENAVVRKWIDFAHRCEKQQFFRLLKAATIESLKEN